MGYWFHEFVTSLLSLIITIFSVCSFRPVSSRFVIKSLVCKSKWVSTDIMVYALIGSLFFFSFISLNRVCGETITLLECSPPDYPEFGGYGPIQDVYTPGDSIHYFCDVDTYIGGNYYRQCLDSGEWTGDTPVCDSPVIFTDIRQTSTAEPEYKNEAERASDGSKTSCSSTKLGERSEWTATLQDVTQVIRVMLFLPKGQAAYEVFAVRPDGTELSCGGPQNTNIVRYEWIFHNCPGPNNVGMSSIRIKATTNGILLRLCEVAVHVLTEPVCVDPHVFVEDGRLMLSRKKAVLVCDRGFTKSTNTRIECIRTGVWERKLLYCIDTEREIENVPGTPIRDQNERPGR